MKQLFFAIAMLGLFAAASFAIDAPAVQARVPFDFSAGPVQAPAGVYTLDRNASSGVLMLKDAKGHVKALLHTTPVYKNQLGQQPMLVFNKIGDRYFLNRVWSSSGPGFELQKSKVEKELRASAQTEQVLVAATSR